jgi:hypothetical protein
MLIPELAFNGEDAHHSEVSNPPPRSLESTKKPFHPLDPSILAQLSVVEQMAKELLVSERIIIRTGRHNVSSSKSFDLNKVLPKLAMLWGIFELSSASILLPADMT